MFDALKSDPVVQDTIACAKMFEAALDKGYSLRQYATLVYYATRFTVARQSVRRGLCLEKKYYDLIEKQEKAFDADKLTKSVLDTLRKI